MLNLRPGVTLKEFSLRILIFLYIKRPVVEIQLDIKNKIMSPVEDNIAQDAIQQKTLNNLVISIYMVFDASR